ncbi:hypothetical protein [Borealpox virus]|nr:hypothetical protein [Alaskapox virus]
MSKLLTFFKNKIIELISNDKIKYSRVIMIEETDSLLQIDDVYSNHGFDCMDIIDDKNNEKVDQYKTDSFFTIN